MNHSPEPWKWERHFLHAHGGSIVLSCAEGYEEPPSAEDAQRIVACVNACRGIPTEELEQKGLPE